MVLVTGEMGKGKEKDNVNWLSRYFACHCNGESAHGSAEVTRSGGRLRPNTRETVCNTVGMTRSAMATQSRGTESTSRSDGEGVLGVIEVVVWLDALETQDWSR